MDNNQNNVFGQSPVQKAPANFNIIELIAAACAGVGLLMVILGTIFTCTCSAKKTFDSSSDGQHGLSAVFIVTIFGVMFALAAVVLAVIAIKQKDAAVKAGKLSQVSFVVGCFATMVGLLPLFTICGYNCSLNNASEKMSDMDEDDYDDLYDFDWSDYFN